MKMRNALSSSKIACHVCGYDLRAHPADGACPECGASIAESHRQAMIPQRPAWRDSDPRWRRRVLAGLWVLLLLPVPPLLKLSDWISNLPAPNVFHLYGGLT